MFSESDAARLWLDKHADGNTRCSSSGDKRSKKKKNSVMTCRLLMSVVVSVCVNKGWWGDMLLLSDQFWQTWDPWASGLIRRTDQEDWSIGDDWWWCFCPCVFTEDIFSLALWQEVQSGTEQSCWTVSVFIQPDTFTPLHYSDSWVTFRWLLLCPVEPFISWCMNVWRMKCFLFVCWENVPSSVK